MSVFTSLIEGLQIFEKYSDASKPYNFEYYVGSTQDGDGLIAAVPGIELTQEDKDKVMSLGWNYHRELGWYYPWY